VLTAPNARLTDPEPSGQVLPAPAGGLFVVHKHFAAAPLRPASEMAGVLRSWRTPGRRRTRHKRLAVHVEDHPLEYGDFEGIIRKAITARSRDRLDRGQWIPLEIG